MKNSLTELNFVQAWQDDLNCPANAGPVTHKQCQTVWQGLRQTGSPLSLKQWGQLDFTLLILFCLLSAEPLPVLTLTAGACPLAMALRSNSLWNVSVVLCRLKPVTNFIVTFPQQNNTVQMQTSQFDSVSKITFKHPSSSHSCHTLLC